MDGLRVQELHHHNFREEGQAAEPGGTRAQTAALQPPLGLGYRDRESGSSTIPSLQGGQTTGGKVPPASPRLQFQDMHLLSWLTRHTLKSLVVSRLCPDRFCLLNKQ